MSLRAHIQQAVRAGIAALDDLPERATYTSVATPSYTPATGTVVTPTTVFASIPMVFTSFARMEIDGEAIRADDQKAIIATQDLTPVPTVNDTIVRTDGTIWSVIGIKRDPAGAAWVLYIRKP